MDLARASGSHPNTVRLYEEWASRAPASSADAVPAREAAYLVGATAEQLRNWERNGLIDEPRQERTGCRLYGIAELGRARVIRTLLLAGYSMMAIRRMTAELDRGRTGALAVVLDTPREDEDVLTAIDRWRSFLSAQERRAELLSDLLRARLPKTSPETRCRMAAIWRVSYCFSVTAPAGGLRIF